MNGWVLFNASIGVWCLYDYYANEEKSKVMLVLGILNLAVAAMNWSSK